MRINDAEAQELANEISELLENIGKGQGGLKGKELVSALVTACMSKWFDLTSKFRSRPEIYDVADAQPNDSYNVVKMTPGADVRDDAFESISKATTDIAKELNRLFGSDVFEPRITRQEGRLEALVGFTNAKGGIFQAKGEPAEGHTTIHLTMPNEAELDRAFSALTDTPDLSGNDLEDPNADPIASEEPVPSYDAEFDVPGDVDQGAIDAEFEEPEDFDDPMDDLSAEEADRMFGEAYITEGLSTWNCLDADQGVLGQVEVEGGSKAASKACKAKYGSECTNIEGTSMKSESYRMEDDIMDLLVANMDRVDNGHFSPRLGEEYTAIVDIDEPMESDFDVLRRESLEAMTGQETIKEFFGREKAGRIRKQIGGGEIIRFINKYAREQEGDLTENYQMFLLSQLPQAVLNGAVTASDMYKVNKANFMADFNEYFDPGSYDWEDSDLWPEEDFEFTTPSPEQMRKDLLELLSEMQWNPISFWAEEMLNSEQEQEAVEVEMSNDPQAGPALEPTLEASQMFRLRIENPGGDKVSKSFASEREAEQYKRRNRDFAEASIEVVEESCNKGKKKYKSPAEKKKMKAMKEEAPAMSVGAAVSTGKSPSPDVIKDVKGKKAKKRKPLKRFQESADVVGVGSWVTVEYDNGRVKGPKRVTEPGTSAGEKSFSIGSPLGRAIAGKGVGDTGTVEAGEKPYATVRIVELDNTEARKRYRGTADYDGKYADKE